VTGIQAHFYAVRIQLGKFTSFLQTPHFAFTPWTENTTDSVC